MGFIKVAASPILQLKRALAYTLARTANGGKAFPEIKIDTEK
jgi:hypothetical protein